MQNRHLEPLFRKLSNSPKRLSWVEAYLLEQESVSALLDAVDESPYGLGQWIDAFIVVGQWMEVRGLRASFQEQLGYVGCACEAAGTGANLTTLPGIVSEMLDEYGFEGAVEA